MYVLLIEDDPHTARGLIELIERGHEDEFQVGWAGDLEPAARLARQETPDLVLLDLGLPSSQGLDTLRSWREEFPQLGVVVLTGLDHESLALSALRQGAQDYLCKADLNRRGLLRALRHAWERKQNQEHLEQARRNLESKVAERTRELSSVVRDLEEEIALREVAQKELARTERFFRSVSESMQNGVLVSNEQDEIFWVNRAAQKITGLSRALLLGVNLATGSAPPALQVLAPFYQAARSSGQPAQLDDLSAPGPGREMISFSGWLVPQVKEGRFTRMICTLQDITPRKRTEQRLRESEAKWRSLTEHSMDHIYLLDLAGKVLFVNSALGGVPRHEVIGASFLDHLGYESRPQIEACQQEVRRWGKPRVFEMDYASGPDRFISLEGQVSPVLEDQRITGFTVSLRDITERKAHAVQLASQTRSLEEVNIALRVLLKYRYDEKRRLEEDVGNNLRKLVTPYLERLAASPVSSEQKALLEIIESNLQEITSNFASVLSSSQVGLTRRELEVARMVQQGSSSTQIAVTLGISRNAVGFHRRNIREKLGIKGRKINLRGYLMGFVDPRPKTSASLSDDPER